MYMCVCVRVPVHMVRVPFAPRVVFFFFLRFECISTHAPGRFRGGVGRVVVPCWDQPCPSSLLEGTSCGMYAQHTHTHTHTCARSRSSCSFCSCCCCPTQNSPFQRGARGKEEEEERRGRVVDGRGREEKKKRRRGSEERKVGRVLEMGRERELTK